MTPEPTTRQDLRLAASSPLAGAEAHQAETCTCTTAGPTVAANRSSAPLNWVSPFVLSSAAADAHATRKRKIRNRRTSPPRIYRFPVSRVRSAAATLRSYSARNRSACALNIEASDSRKTERFAVPISA